MPTSEGIWWWIRKDDKREFDLPVYNVGDPLNDLYLRVYFLGSYYDIDDFINGTWLAKVNHNPDGAITKQLRGWVHPDDVMEGFESVLDLSEK
jgi:hypothetical protein